MTGNTNKTRAVILAALMVLSVFAGTIAFTGSAAAQDYAGGAVQFDNDTSSNTNWIIEVPTDGFVDNSTADKSNVTLLDDGDEINDEVDRIITVNGQNSSGAVVLELNGKYASNDLEVEFNDQFSGGIAGSTFDVEFAASTIDGDGFASGNSNQTLFAGETVAVVNETDASGGSSVSIEGDGNNYFQTFANGTNSSVFYVNTDDLSGDYEYDESGNFLVVRDLGLGVSIDDLNVTTDDSIEGTVNAVDSGRDVTVELLDSSGDVEKTDTGELSGQGEYDFDFSASDIDTGDYSVEVTDNNTQIQVESSTVTVSEASDADVNFASNSIVNQRGDFIEFTVEMTSTSEATISFGSASDGVKANATVEDDDGDDQVTVYLNTYNLGNGNDVFSLDDDSDDVINNQNNQVQTNDLVDAGSYDLEVEADDQTVATGVTNADDVATVTLDERSTDTLRMWTGSSDELGTVSNLEDVNEGIANGEITQSSEIAVGDYAVHQVVASGLEGALDARDNEDVTQNFNDTVRSGPLNLTIEESSPGANQDASELNLSYGDNVTVIADGANDTYFIIVDTGDVGLAAPRNESLPQDDDTSLETNFTILQDDAGFDFTPDSDFDDDENSETFVEFNANEPDVNVDEPFDVANAEGQTISGDTNIAPGTELTIRVRSQDGTSPSFLKTASPVVQPDGSFNATFDFSGQNVGDQYDIVVVNPFVGDTEEEGEVVESMSMTTEAPDTTTEAPDTTTEAPDTTTEAPDTTTEAPDTTTEEPATETPTSTPGFGVVVALTALIAAALLAIRRD
ncbi:DUF7827 domain-containing protein [Halobellus clavatus]|uniref:PGF-CTERM protein/surface glycoprotein n=1 Tax=Halobellus clavatus TaxID=660517 RepID=A0A1H3JTB0_9EURY|nr:BGTF surface domain-containing protein [Halobellus clavatus]SDY43153.1 PGF-CTERM protein/surface glycoprotein [Halobellus clavatus]